MTKRQILSIVGDIRQAWSKDNSTLHSHLRDPGAHVLYKTREDLRYVLQCDKEQHNNIQYILKRLNAIVEYFGIEFETIPPQNEKMIARKIKQCKK